MGNRQKTGPRGVRPLEVIAFILCLCGAFFFAYQTYDTVRQAVVSSGVPVISNLPSLPFVPSADRTNVPNILGGERVNILVLGIDRRPSDKCPCRTDTMILMSLDPKTSTAAAVTIPRDLYVPIPQVGEDRINTAYFYGDLNKLPGGGAALAKQTVEYNLGRSVPFYVVVDFTGFIKVVDTLGGIDVDVPKPIDDPTYPAMDSPNFDPLHIPAGHIHMDGLLALKYARTRHADNDFGRSRRQIQVLLAIRDKALQLNVLPKLPQLVQSLWGTLETDLQPQDVIALAQAASKVKSENIKAATIDQTMTTEFLTNTGADVLWPDRVKIGLLLDQLIPQEDAAATPVKNIQQEAARILILNGSKSAQLGERTARFLQAQGYQVIAYGNADRTDYAKTILLDYSGSKDATVTALAKLFHVDPLNIRRTPDPKNSADIRIILGADWTPPVEKTQP